MKNIRKLIAVLLCTVLCCLMAISFAESEISVNGTGETYISADTVYITLGVQTRQTNVREAQSSVNEKIKAVREAIIAMGIPEEDINTDQLNIYMYTEFTDAGEERIVYHVSSMLTIRSDDVTAAGSIIDAAFAEGANTLDGVRFTAAETEEAENAAIRAAVADARRKADVIAEASGLKITGIEKLSEGYVSSFDSGVNNFTMTREEAKAAGASTEIQAAKLCVTAQITVVYEAEEAGQ